MSNGKYGKETYYRNGVLFSVEELTIIIPKLKNYPRMMSMFKQEGLVLYVGSRCLMIKEIKISTTLKCK